MLAAIITASIGSYIGTVKAATILYVDDNFNSSTPGWGIDHFSKIQDAVDAATGGETISVYPGLYNEHIMVDSLNNLRFIGQKGGQPVKSVIVDGGGFTVFTIYNSVGVMVSGFKIVNGNVGILASGTTGGADYCDFSNNYIQDCPFGSGIQVFGSHCNITNNFLNYTEGIEVGGAGQNTVGTVVSKNTILSSFPYWGIDLWNGVDCVISNNFMHNCSVGVRLGYVFGDCSGNKIMNNEMSDVVIGIKFTEPVYPGTPPMTYNVVGNNYIHHDHISPSIGIDIEISGGAAEYSQIYRNTIDDFDVGIYNHGNYGTVHHNAVLNCLADYVDLGTGNVDYKNSWNT